MHLPFPYLATALTVALGCSHAFAQQTYRGFDRNDYPGDAALPVLKKSFAFTGYWLNNPPGETRNSWAGKRTLLKKQGFGFVILFNGRAYAELKGKDGTAIGAADGVAAAAAAAKEGFAKNVLIFLDQEEGGRLLPEQLAYIFGWVDAVSKLGVRPGVYCSGIDVPDGNGKISTARQLIQEEERRANMMKAGSPGAQKRSIALWVANDQCPPAPGCTATTKPPSAGLSLESKHAMVWQYAQSPRRKEFTSACAKSYAADGNCYAPGLTHSAAGFVDLNVAGSADPSETP